MNFIFISPHFPPSFQQFVKALHAEGVNVLAIGDTPCHALSHELRGALSEYCHPPDMHQYEAVYRAVAHLASNHGRIDRIESLNEHWLEIEARLREDFNVPGPKPGDLNITRRKMGMKTVFHKHGVPCTEGEAVLDRTQLERYVARTGYPVIFKPDIGVGAAQTFLVSNEEELRPRLERPPQGYVVERYVSGDLVSFDGLTDARGEVLFCTSMQVNSGIMEIVQHKLEMHYWFRRAIPATLEDLGRKTVQGFGIRERFFHIEFFKESEDRYRAIEINVRPPGGYSLDMMNYQCDFDVYRIYARMMARGEKPTVPERKYCVTHAARRHGQTYRYSHDELTWRLGNRLITHMPVPDVFSPAMGNYTYLIRDPDEAALREAIAMVQERG